MAYRRSARRSVKRRSFRSRSSRRAKFTASSRIKRVVKSIVMRNIETKHNDYTSTSIPVYNNITGLDIFPCIPDMTQGTGQSNRTGNRINPRRLKIKIALTALNASSIYAGASPTYFDIYIFKSKFVNYEGGAPASVDMSLFLQNDNSASAYTGAITSGLRPINSDMFTLVKRKRLVLSNLSSTVANAPYQTYNPNRTITFDVSKALKKTLIYDDNSTLITNDNLYIAIGATQTDGTSLGGNAVGSYQFLSFLEYKDG